MTDLKTLYETDTVAWSEQQAAALRAAARGGSNQPLDWELAILDLEEHGEIDQMELPTIKNARYTEGQVLDDWFPEEPAR
jgi:hypothetical protein